ncbi:hypothetical protein PPMP20_18575 [Paraburkholderia phymatum]|uniref:hypothetical protein n=1 Tax=Paraburkholderia phymatum TaxID=148447 RepID=UPI0012FDF323|nr:hypothetical protein [Paraburkholderia phymatum]
MHVAESCAAEREAECGRGDSRGLDAGITDPDAFACHDICDEVDAVVWVVNSLATLSGR